MTETTSTFRDRYGPWALVAGASQGIGEAFSRKLAERGFDLVLIARRTANLEKLANELRASFGVEIRVISLDLGHPDLAKLLRPQIEGLPIGLLVYNACATQIGPFLKSDFKAKLAIVDVNCRGPLVMVSELAPAMVARGKGGILLMSSASGFQGGPLIATYAASKAFNTVLAEGLWEELRKTGVDVLAFVAGATSTPNFVASTPQEKQAASYPMTPEDVAEQGLAALGKGPTAVAGRVNRIITFVLGRLLSRRAAVTFMGSQLRKIYGGTNYS